MVLFGIIIWLICVVGYYGVIVCKYWWFDIRFDFLFINIIIKIMWCDKG